MPPRAPELVTHIHLKIAQFLDFIVCFFSTCSFCSLTHWVTGFFVWGCEVKYRREPFFFTYSEESESPVKNWLILKCRYEKFDFRRAVNEAHLLLSYFFIYRNSCEQPIREREVDWLSRLFRVGEVLRLVSRLQNSIKWMEISHIIWNVNSELCIYIDSNLSIQDTKLRINPF